MVWVDTELDTELFGRKNDVMEYGDKKCWSVWLDNELSLLSDRELAAWKSEKMVAIPSPLSDRDVGFGNGFHQIILWLKKTKRENFGVTETGREGPTNGLHNTEGRVASYK